MIKILVASSTDFEINPLLEFLQKNGKKISFFNYEYNNLSIYPLVTGVGALQMAFAISRMGFNNSFDLAINAGIGGAFQSRFPLGSVVHIHHDRFGDLGSENADGSFSDLFEMGLLEANTFPYKNGWLYPKNKLNLTSGLTEVTGITVNKVLGKAESIAEVTQKYNPDIVSMEGAGFYYASMMLDMNAIQIRAVSNLVEPRNKENWNIPLAIQQLNISLIDLLQSIG